jgi:hypothetical protein
MPTQRRLRAVDTPAYILTERLSDTFSHVCPRELNNKQGGERPTKVGRPKNTAAAKHLMSTASACVYKSMPRPWEQPLRGQVNIKGGEYFERVAVFGLGANNLVACAMMPTSLPLGTCSQFKHTPLQHNQQSRDINVSGTHTSKTKPAEEREKKFHFSTVTS